MDIISTFMIILITMSKQVSYPISMSTVDSREKYYDNFFQCFQSHLHIEKLNKNEIYIEQQSNNAVIVSIKYNKYPNVIHASSIETYYMLYDTEREQVVISPQKEKISLIDEDLFVYQSIDKWIVIIDPTKDMTTSFKPFPWDPCYRRAKSVKKAKDGYYILELDSDRGDKRCVLLETWKENECNKYALNIEQPEENVFQMRYISPRDDDGDDMYTQFYDAAQKKVIFTWPDQEIFEKAGDHAYISHNQRSWNGHHKWKFLWKKTTEKGLEKLNEERYKDLTALQGNLFKFSIDLPYDPQCDTFNCNGAIDVDNKQILPPEFYNLAVIWNHFVVVKRVNNDPKYWLYNLKGVNVLPVEYDAYDASIFNGLKTWFILFEKGGLKTVVWPKGGVMLDKISTISVVNDKTLDIVSDGVRGYYTRSFEKIS